ncbi:heme ABC transporter permease CcmC [Magnetococcales bacterium HHB-1]
MEKLIRLEYPLLGLSLLFLTVGLVMGWSGPMDFQQGGSVRILYIHVPSAKMALLFYIILTLCSIWYLWKKSETADILAEAAVSVGALFTGVTLLSGSIWGKPMWGTWWAWDARLTSVLVLFILYIGLIALRSALEESHKAAKATAVTALIGAVDLPIIHFSVVWWRTLHQPASFSGVGKAPAIAGPFLTPLMLTSLGLLLFALYLWIVKAHNVALKRRLDLLEEKWDDRDDE